MKILTIYYSYTGTCKKAAEEIAKKRNTDLCEIKDIKKPSVLAAYTIGCFRALRQKSSPIEPLRVDISNYDRFVILSPVWANNPAPAIFSLLDMLPEKKKVEFIQVSKSGNSKSRIKIAAKVKSKGSTMDQFKNLKESDIIKKKKV